MCKNGFLEEEKDGKCIDINECLTQQNTCTEEFTECINKAGTYECKCKNGFTQSLNGSCTGINDAKNFLQTFIYFKFLR